MFKEFRKTVNKASRNFHKKRATATNRRPREEQPVIGNRPAKTWSSYLKDVVIPGRKDAKANSVSRTDDIQLTPRNSTDKSRTETSEHSRSNSSIDSSEVRKNEAMIADPIIASAPIDMHSPSSKATSAFDAILKRPATFPELPDIPGSLTAKSKASQVLKNTTSTAITVESNAVQVGADDQYDEKAEFAESADPNGSKGSPKKADTTRTHIFDTRIKSSDASSEASGNNDIDNVPVYESDEEGKPIPHSQPKIATEQKSLDIGEAAHKKSEGPRNLPSQVSADRSAKGRAARVAYDKKQSVSNEDRAQIFPENLRDGFLAELGGIAPTDLAEHALIWLQNLNGCVLMQNRIQEIRSLIDGKEPDNLKEKDLENLGVPELKDELRKATKSLAEHLSADHFNISKEFLKTMNPDMMLGAFSHLQGWRSIDEKNSAEPQPKAPSSLKASPGLPPQPSNSQKVQSRGDDAGVVESDVNVQTSENSVDEEMRPLPPLPEDSIDDIEHETHLSNSLQPKTGVGKAEVAKPSSLAVSADLSDESKAVRKFNELVAAAVKKTDSDFEHAASLAFDDMGWDPSTYEKLSTTKKKTYYNGLKRHAALNILDYDVDKKAPKVLGIYSADSTQPDYRRFAKRMTKALDVQMAERLKFSHETPLKAKGVPKTPKVEESQAGKWSDWANQAKILLLFKDKKLQKIAPNRMQNVLRNATANESGKVDKQAFVKFAEAMNRAESENDLRGTSKRMFEAFRDDAVLGISFTYQKAALSGIMMVASSGKFGDKPDKEFVECFPPEIRKIIPALDEDQRELALEFIKSEGKAASPAFMADPTLQKLRQIFESHALGASYLSVYWLTAKSARDRLLKANFF
jgi:hypothetical protein